MNSKTHRGYLWVGACTAISFYLLYRWGLNAWVHPAFHDVLPVARELSTAIEALTCFVLIAALINSEHAGTIVKVSRITAPFFMTIGLVLYFLGVQFAQVWLLAIGAFFCGVGGPWLFISTASTLLTLSMSGALLAVLVGSFIQCLVSLVAGTANLSLPVMIALQIVICLGCFLYGWKSTASLPKIITSQTSLATELFLNPRSFIPASHPLFTSVVLAGIVRGIALTYGSSLSNPIQTPASFLLFLVVVGVALLLVKSRTSLDALYLSAATLIVAGLAFFFPATFTAAADTSVHALPNLLFNASNECLTALALLVSAAIGKRNPVDFFRIAALYAGCICLGIIGGATIGHGLNAVLSEQAGLIIWAFSTGAVVFAFYNFVLLRSFSFDRAVNNVQSSEKPRVVSPSESFGERCQAIAETFSLTPRETEILEYYARGRSTNVVQEALVLSYNTVRSHVKNIYRKTGVHSQQELIDLIDGWSDKEQR